MADLTVGTMAVHSVRYLAVQLDVHWAAKTVGLSGEKSVAATVATWAWSWVDHLVGHWVVPTAVATVEHSVALMAVYWVEKWAGLMADVRVVRSAGCWGKRTAE